MTTRPWRRSSRTKPTALVRLVQFVAVPVAVLSVWEAASALGMVSRVFLPPPTRVLSALTDLLADGLLAATGVTAARALAGLAVAVLIAVPLGVAIATSPGFDALTRPGREFLRVLPTVTVVPAFMAVLGVGNSLPITVVAFGSVWPILLGTVHGVRSMGPTLVDVARVHRLGPATAALKVRIPAALGQIVTGVRISLAIALVVTLVAEMMTGAGGLGAQVIEARSRFRTADVFALVVVIGVLGFLLNALMARIERRARAAW